MITSGIKLHVGYCVAAFAAAALYGYTTGGNHVGPLTVGYKGGVGEHIGYALLIGLAIVTALLAVAHAAFRDADPAAAAQLLGLDSAPAAQRPTSPSIWPLLGALGAGATLVGLVVHPAVFVTGVVVLVVTAFEWMMDAWADRATGDPAVNRELRERIMRPIEIPVLAFVGIGVLVLAISRIFLASSKNGAVFVAIGVAGAIFVGAVVFSRVQRVPRGLIGGVLVVGIVGVIAGGIVAAANGEREFEHHGEDLHEETGTEAAE